MFLINLIFWLWVFIVPVALLGLAAFLLYNKSPDNLPYSILISLAGVAAGAAFAEHVRKKHGLAHFFGKLLSTPELEDNKQQHEDKAEGA